MIAPMKKVRVVVLDSRRTQSLKRLRKLGMLHVEAMQGSGTGHEAMVRALSDAEKVIGMLSTIKAEDAGGSLSRAQASAVITETLDTHEKIRLLHEESASLTKEYERIRDWGDIRPESLTELKTEGFSPRFFECSPQRIPSLPPDLDYVRLAAPKGRVRLAVIGSTAVVPADLAEFVPPSRSPSWMTDRMAAIAREIKLEQEGLIRAASTIKNVIEEKKARRADLELETIRSGMESTGPVAYLSGFAPAADIAALTAEARSQGWGILTDDPADDELPPTKVENSAIVRMVNPVFEFLGTVPNYREYDISAWFLGFFSLYFAMIFGDGGYGLILLATGLFLALKAKGKGGVVPDAVRLLLLLGVTTITWGTVTATWFAIPFDRLPSFLSSLAVTAIRNGNPEADANIKIFCFAIGALQLAIAHIKNIKRDFPNLKFLAQFGSLIMVVGMFTIVLNLVIDPARFPIPFWSLPCIAGGFLLVFTFGNWDGNLLQSLKGGFIGIIPTFLGTVSVFADIVSYIRLWAVGLAGLAISQTVNGMASGMFGEPAGQIISFIIGGIMGIFLLGVGHSLNLVMSVLSVVVHGIRLNILEFSGHLGMEWSGYKYDPLRETVSESNE